MSTQSELDRQMQFAVEREAEAFQKQVVYEWLAKKLSEPSDRKYVPCQANAELLATYIEEVFDSEWSVEHLDAAYNHLNSQGVLVHDVSLQPASASPAPPNTPTITVTRTPANDVPPGWPRTKSEIARMAPADYRSCYHSKVHGEKFRAHINRVLKAGI